MRYLAFLALVIPAAVVAVYIASIKLRDRMNPAAVIDDEVQAQARANYRSLQEAARLLELSRSHLLRVADYDQVLPMTETDRAQCHLLAEKNEEFIRRFYGDDDA
jgi:hypothetical protein